MTSPLLYLGQGVQVHHGIGEWVGVGAKVVYQLQHGAVKGAVDLSEGGGPGVVHVDDRDVTKEPGEQKAVSRRDSFTHYFGKLGRVNPIALMGGLVINHVLKSLFWRKKIYIAVVTVFGLLLQVASFPDSTPELFYRTVRE